MQLPAGNHPPLAPYPPVTEVARRGCGPSGWRGSAGQLADGVSYYRAGGGEFALWCPEDVHIEEPMSLARAPVRHQLLITAPTADVDPADPIVRVVDAAVYVRPARDGLMVGGFEADPLPVDPREQPASFATDDVPLDLGVLRTMAGRVAVEVPVVGSASVAEHRGGMFTMSHPAGGRRARPRETTHSAVISHEH